jgi:type IV pilus assembly protein PilV
MSDDMTANTRTRKVSGFSLVEVMVAVVVICVGLLGIAKMQALALSNTSNARLRSLAAFQAASLASAMHSNRDYWAATAPALITATPNGGLAPTLAGSDAAMLGLATGNLATWPAEPASCVEITCQPINLAAFDLAWWLSSLNALLPSPGATISCTQTAPAACTIQISWTENVVSQNTSEINKSGAGGGASVQQFQNPTYTLYVEP